MAEVRVIQNEKDTENYAISTRLMMIEALKKDYIVEFYPSSPSTNSGIVRVEKKRKEAYFRSTTLLTTPSYGVFAADNKALMHSLLEAKGVPMPDTVVLSPDDAANKGYAMLDEYKKVVVKPVGTDHGDGVTVGVSTKGQLEKAVTFARSVSPKDAPDILVQQQVDGEEYRFLVVDRKVVAVAGRRPPYVTGDGKRTVSALIDEKNSDPRRGDGHNAELTKIDSKDVIHHKGAAFMKKVPAKGERVQLLDTSNLSRGGEAIDYTDVASKELKKLAVLAAESSFLGVGGIDIMTDDITTQDLSQSYVIETNLGPGIRMHTYPSEGTPRNVAAEIFKVVEKHLKPVDKPVISIGRSEKISFPEFNRKSIPARIDTGATVSSIWASNIKQTPEGLSFVLFDKKSEYYNGEVITIPVYSKRTVSSSMGHTQDRYQVRFLMTIHGRKIRAMMTLADRSSQTYPVLIGRNVLRNKFIVDVSAGKPIVAKERAKRQELDKRSKGESL